MWGERGSPYQHEAARCSRHCGVRVTPDAHRLKFDRLISESESEEEQQQEDIPTVINPNEGSSANWKAFSRGALMSMPVRHVSQCRKPLSVIRLSIQSDCF